MKIVCQASLPSFLTRVSLAINISFRTPTAKWKLSVRLSIFVIGGREDNSLVHKLREMAVVELHVNATFYDQHPDALKSLYENSQSVMGG